MKFINHIYNISEKILWTKKEYLPQYIEEAYQKYLYLWYRQAQLSYT